MSGRKGFPYEPDYVTPPGEVLHEYMEYWAITLSELAKRSGLSAELIEGLLAGRAPLEAETALKLEKVFDLKADVWLRMEANYRRGLEQGRKVPEFNKESVG